jgi:hypothetical protein
MPLAQIADHDDDAGSDHLADECIPMEVFHEKLEKEIIDDQVDEKGQQVAEQLYMPAQVGLYKHQVFIEYEPNHEVDAE